VAKEGQEPALTGGSRTAPRTLYFLRAETGRRYMSRESIVLRCLRAETGDSEGDRGRSCAASVWKLGSSKQTEGSAKLP